jgi:hypothetical protein
MTVSTESDPAWRKLGEPSPDSLADARLQLHHAAQIVASVGLTYVEPAKDDSHTNLEWVDSLAALVTKSTAGDPPFQAALQVGGLRLLLLDAKDGNTIYSEYDLHGQTIEDAYGWLELIVERFTGTPLSKDFVRSPNPIPDHPVAQGGSFSFAPKEAFHEIRRWYANCDRVLRRIEAETPKASPVRCWPHHFDIATLIEFAPAREREAGGSDSGRSIGIGMTPGDAKYAEPYLYVTPWPYPNDPPLSDLSGEGEWHTDGWLGAVLTGPKLVATGEAQDQATRVDDFLASALKACRDLVGVPS